MVQTVQVTETGFTGTAIPRVAQGLRVLIQFDIGSVLCSRLVDAFMLSQRVCLQLITLCQ